MLLFLLFFFFGMKISRESLGFEVGMCTVMDGARVCTSLVVIVVWAI